MLDGPDGSALDAPAVGGRHAEQVLVADVARSDLGRRPRRAEQIDVIGPRRLDEAKAAPPLPRKLPHEGGRGAAQRVAAKRDQLAILDQGGRLLKGMKFTHEISCRFTRRSSGNSE